MGLVIRTVHCTLIIYIYYTIVFVFEVNGDDM